MKVAEASQIMLTFGLLVATIMSTRKQFCLQYNKRPTLKVNVSLLSNNNNQQRGLTHHCQSLSLSLL